MSKFIELHRCDKEESPVLINMEQIAYIQNVKNKVVIYLGLKSGVGSDTILIKEPYEEVKNLIVGS